MSRLFLILSSLGYGDCQNNLALCLSALGYGGDPRPLDLRQRLRQAVEESTDIGLPFPGCFPRQELLDVLFRGGHAEPQPGDLPNGRQLFRLPRQSQQRPGVALRQPRLPQGGEHRLPMLQKAKLVGDVMKTTDQVMQSLTDVTGVDIKSVIAGYLGGKASQ